MTGKILGTVILLAVFTVWIWAVGEHMTNIKNTMKCGRDWKETGCNDK